MQRHALNHDFDAKLERLRTLQARISHGAGDDSLPLQQEASTLQAEVDAERHAARARAQGEVCEGSVVELFDATTHRKLTVHVCPDADHAAPGTEVVPPESPVGRELLGLKVGERFVAPSPSTGMNLTWVVLAKKA